MKPNSTVTSKQQVYQGADASYSSTAIQFMNHRQNIKTINSSVMTKCGSAYAQAAQRFNESALKQRILNISSSRDEDEVASAIASSDNGDLMIYEQ